MRVPAQKTHSGSETAGHDRVILFTDAAGNVDPPGGKTLCPQCASTVLTLQFTFTSAQPWTAAQLAFLPPISDIYPAIKQLLGSPSSIWRSTSGVIHRQWLFFTRH